MPSGHKAAGPASACSDFPGSGVDPLVSGGAGSLGSVWEPDHSPCLRGRGRAQSYMLLLTMGLTPLTPPIPLNLAPSPASVWVNVATLTDGKAGLPS